MMRSRFSGLLLGLLLAGCVAHVPPATADAAKLTSPDGTERAYRDLVAAASWTVFVFVSADCPCLTAHLDRLRELAVTYAPRGVQFVAVDSEVGVTQDLASAEARALALPFPLLIDSKAKLANAFGAEYATYTVVADREGRVRYRGGVDSDKRKIHADATPFLQEALDDALSGATPRRLEGKALGCVLRKW